MYSKISELCHKRGISISDLETANGLGKKTVYRWDKMIPSVDKVKKVADYFGVTVDELIGDKKD